MKILKKKIVIDCLSTRGCVFLFFRINSLQNTFDFFRLMPASAFNDFFFFNRRPSLVKLDLRSDDLSRDPVFVGALATLKPLPRIFITEVFPLPPEPMTAGLMDSIEALDVDDFRKNLLVFFGAFGYLKGLKDADG